MQNRRIKLYGDLKAKAKMKTVDVTDIKKLKELSSRLVNTFSSSQIVLFQGPLGVGKTQMICFMAEGLGVSRKSISSPAFSLINTYKNSKGDDIYHLDLFRLNNQNELESIGFWDIFSNPSIVFIEWGNILRAEELPSRWSKLFIFLEFKEKNQRVLKYEFKDHH